MVKLIYRELSSTNWHQTIGECLYGTGLVIKQIALLHVLSQKWYMINVAYQCKHTCVQFYCRSHAHVVQVDNNTYAVSWSWSTDNKLGYYWSSWFRVYPQRIVSNGRLCCQIVMSLYGNINNIDINTKKYTIQAYGKTLFLNISDYWRYKCEIVGINIVSTDTRIHDKTNLHKH